MSPSLCFAACASPCPLARPPGLSSVFATGRSLRRPASPAAGPRSRQPASLPARNARPVPTATLSALSVLPGIADPTVLRSSLSAISKLMTTLFIGIVAAKRGLLDPSTLTALSKSVYNIFLPSLLLTNVIRTLSAGSSGGLLFLPLAAVAQVFIGLCLGLLGAAALRLNQSERRIFLVCCGFGNSGALPLLFANALFASSPAQLAAMVSGISFFLIGWTSFFWSVGYSILAGLPDPRAPAGAPKMAEKKASNSMLVTVVKRVLSPPLVAAIIGLSIGLSPACGAFMSSPAFSALQTLGTGYSPAAVLILAGSLARKVEPPRGAAAVNPESVLRLRRLAAGISFCRYVLMPILGILLIRNVKVFNTPFVKLALLLETIMPPAQNSTLILNLEKKPDAAANMARILLAVYLVGVVPISVGLTYFLGFAGV